MSEQPSYFKYWGKASKADIDEYHLLPYHCLDVAAVGSVWWEGSKKIRDSFCAASKCDLHETKAWILFLLALHDIGKFDIRFQRKVPDIQRRLQRIEASPRLSHADSKNYLHGPAGLYWFGHEFEHNILKKDDETRAVSDDPFDFDWGEEETRDPAWEAWKPLIEAVAGHHGHIIAAENNAISPLPIDCPATYADLDKNARDSWIDALAALFLEPAGVSLLHVPPAAPSVAFWRASVLFRIGWVQPIRGNGLTTFKHRWIYPIILNRGRTMHIRRFRLPV